MGNEEENRKGDGKRKSIGKGKGRQEESPKQPTTTARRFNRIRQTHPERFSNFRSARPRFGSNEDTSVPSSTRSDSLVQSAPTVGSGTSASGIPSTSRFSASSPAPPFTRQTPSQLIPPELFYPAFDAVNIAAIAGPSTDPAPTLRPATSRLPQMLPGDGRGQYAQLVDERVGLSAEAHDGTPMGASSGPSPLHVLSDLEQLCEPVAQFDATEEANWFVQQIEQLHMSAELPGPSTQTLDMPLQHQGPFYAPSNVYNLPGYGQDFSVHSMHPRTDHVMAMHNRAPFIPSGPHMPPPMARDDFVQGDAQVFPPFVGPEVGAPQYLGMPQGAAGTASNDSLGLYDEPQGQGPAGCWPDFGQPRASPSRSILRSTGIQGRGVIPVQYAGSPQRVHVEIGPDRNTPTSRVHRTHPYHRSPRERPHPPSLSVQPVAFSDESYRRVAGSSMSPVTPFSSAGYATPRAGGSADTLPTSLPEVYPQFAGPSTFTGSFSSPFFDYGPGPSHSAMIPGGGSGYIFPQPLPEAYSHTPTDITPGRPGPSSSSSLANYNYGYDLADAGVSPMRLPDTVQPQTDVQLPSTSRLQTSVQLPNIMQPQTAVQTADVMQPQNTVYLEQEDVVAMPVLVDTPLVGALGMLDVSARQTAHRSFGFGAPPPRAGPPPECMLGLYGEAGPLPLPRLADEAQLPVAAEDDESQYDDPALYLNMEYYADAGPSQPPDGAQ